MTNVSISKDEFKFAFVKRLTDGFGLPKEARTVLLKGEEVKLHGGWSIAIDGIILGEGNSKIRWVDFAAVGFEKKTSVKGWKFTLNDGLTISIDTIPMPSYGH